MIIWGNDVKLRGQGSYCVGTHAPIHVVKRNYFEIGSTGASQQS
jgi:hypothetical protein